MKAKHVVRRVSLTRFSLEAWAGIVLMFLVYGIAAVVLTNAVVWIRDIVDQIKALMK